MSLYQVRPQHPKTPLCALGEPGAPGLPRSRLRFASAARVYPGVPGEGCPCGGQSLPVAALSLRVPAAGPPSRSRGPASGACPCPVPCVGRGWVPRPGSPARARCGPLGGLLYAAQPAVARLGARPLGGFAPACFSAPGLPRPSARRSFIRTPRPAGRGGGARPGPAGEARARPRARGCGLLRFADFRAYGASVRSVLRSFPPGAGSVPAPGPVRGAGGVPGGRFAPGSASRGCRSPCPVAVVSFGWFCARPLGPRPRGLRAAGRRGASAARVRAFARRVFRACGRGAFRACGRGRGPRRRCVSASHWAQSAQRSAVGPCAALRPSAHWAKAQSAAGASSPRYGLSAPARAPAGTSADVANRAESRRGCRAGPPRSARCPPRLT